MFHFGSFIARSIVLMTLMFEAISSHAADAPAAKGDVRIQTFDYKQIGTLAIKADVLNSGEVTTLRPVIVWIHGGALINGHRASIPAWVRESFLPRGYAIVSIDYRLAPESKLPVIVEDVVDAIAWARRDGPKLFQADGKRLAVIGGSAGGYLTLLTGYRVQPAPAALVSLWGYGDLGAPWTYASSTFKRHQSDKQLSSEDVAQIEQGPVISDSRQRQGDGGTYYQLTRRNGTWAEAVSGWNPQRDALKFVPFMPERNVSPQYPPTIILHGDQDTDVPFDSSARMAAALQQHGVEHRLIRFAGAEHGLPNAPPQEVADGYRTAVEFVVKQLDAR